jgi:hypothetical protein
MFVIDPYGWEVVEWVDRMTPSLEPFGDVPELLAEGEWRDWARSIIQNTQIARCQPPDPGLFNDWREWACRFNQTVYGLN